MVVRPETSLAPGSPLRYKRILVLLDSSRQSDWALFSAARLAQAHEAELSVLQVTEEPKVMQRVLYAQLLQRCCRVSPRPSSLHENVP